MDLSTFHIPPCGEVLVLGKRCPIGPEAAKQMLEVVRPGQFELVKPEDDLIDAILVKTYLFKRAAKEALVNAIIEEARAIMGEESMITIRCDIVVSVKRSI